ncbi:MULTISPECIES: hypothetical protein [Streptomyces]|uniref:Membrane protein n=3 Tax=Streptomyces TaxID=1883 RepID=Q9L1Z7_STRCO|nr:MULTISPECIES: hypothetical protein [Streptomyces]WOZ00529.1 hypothetical protein R2E43_25030 [Streptomyces violaceoruber]MDX2926844.1 hypothetical protein [Streptomyces sp. NRRL_B-16638]MDX3420069.1 hypothetical protein [Streptomyces sp. ME02-6985-2c]MYU42166.1 hypothetical protein [Streptomyces sp. SID7813]NSL83609.1 hypothetical protein [Streptomyces coelicolor]
MAAEQHPGGDDALMAAITGEPLPPDAGADARGEYRSATADVALLREQLNLIGGALGGTVPEDRPAPAPAPAPARAPAPRRPFRLAFGVLAAACAGVLVTGLGWLVVQGGSGASDDAASGSAADRSAARPDSPSAGQEAAVVFGTPRYLACARLVAEGTVTAADPVPGTARHRITLRLTHAYAPAKSTGPTTAFVLDDALARLAPGDRVLVGALRDRPTADTVITGDRNIATARARITASLPESRTLTCD